VPKPEKLLEVDQLASAGRLILASGIPQETIRQLGNLMVSLAQAGGQSPLAMATIGIIVSDMLRRIGFIGKGARNLVWALSTTYLGVKATGDLAGAVADIIPDLPFTTATQISQSATSYDIPDGAGGVANNVRDIGPLGGIDLGESGLDLGPILAPLIPGGGGRVGGPTTPPVLPLPPGSPLVPPVVIPPGQPRLPPVTQPRLTGRTPVDVPFRRIGSGSLATTGQAGAAIGRAAAGGAQAVLLPTIPLLDLLSQRAGGGRQGARPPGEAI